MSIDILLNILLAILFTTTSLLLLYFMKLSLKLKKDLIKSHEAHIRTNVNYIETVKAMDAIIDSLMSRGIK